MSDDNTTDPDPFEQLVFDLGMLLVCVGQVRAVLHTHTEGSALAGFQSYCAHLSTIVDSKLEELSQFGEAFDPQ
jgi:hypothetical protein